MCGGGASSPPPPPSTPSWRKREVGRGGGGGLIKEVGNRGGAGRVTVNPIGPDLVEACVCDLPHSVSRYITMTHYRTAAACF